MAIEIKEAEIEIITKHNELCRVRGWLLGAMSFLVGIGLILIYSSSAVKAERFGSSLFFVEQQMKWVAIGLVVMTFLNFFDYRKLLYLRIPCLVFSAGALIFVKISNYGSKVNGAQRWIKVMGLSIQPSEFIKILMVIFLSAFLASKKNELLSFARFSLLITVVALVCGLIAIEPDFGTSMLVGAVLITMIFSAGAKKIHLLGLGLAGVPFVIYYVVSSSNYMMQRINAWLEGGSTGKAYHAYMSIQCMTSGGLFGKGPGAGWAKLWYLPEAHTDFIFAVAGQDLGWICNVAIVMAFSIIVYSGWRIICLVEDKFAILLTFGFVLMIGLQAVFNIAVVTATVPTKGISLPFVSFGGSGLICYMAMIGILSSIARYSYQPYLKLLNNEERVNPWGKLLFANYVAKRS